ncbi:MAG: DUF4244 domain-containing protein, partial [Aeromicrobium sp.]
PDLEDRMTSRTEHGMSTAEYAVGMLGACTIAAVLYRLGTDGTWWDVIADLIREAFSWRNILGHIPRFGLRIR